MAYAAAYLLLGIGSISCCQSPSRVVTICTTVEDFGVCYVQTTHSLRHTHTHTLSLIQADVQTPLKTTMTLCMLNLLEFYWNDIILGKSAQAFVFVIPTLLRLNSFSYFQPEWVTLSFAWPPSWSNLINVNLLFFFFAESIFLKKRLCRRQEITVKQTLTLPIESTGQGRGKKKEKRQRVPVAKHVQEAYCTV